MNASSDQAARLIEAERAQIANEIHDSVLPLLFAASASLTGLTEPSSDRDQVPPEIQQRLRQAKDWIDEAMQTGRRLLSGLYPPELEETGWSLAAVDTVNRLLGDAAGSVVWQLDGNVNRVPDRIAFAAYRIVVEAIRNAVRHGHAREVVVTGSCNDRRLEVVVQDDGGGFDPTRIPSGHFGLRSMMGRAELVGGSLSIDSRTGGPTVVAFSVPLNE